MKALGERMKGYERKDYLVNKVPVIIRVDGKSFHTYTRGMDPFDRGLRTAFVYAMQYTAKEMSNFVLAYHQSDEVSFLMMDDAKVDTQPWFGNSAQKLTSVVSSIFTAFFNGYYGDRLAFFDARAFNVPERDVANYFLWRFKDCERNAKSMLAHQHYSTKELHGKSTEWITENLMEEWLDLDNCNRWGTFYNLAGETWSTLVRDWSDMNTWINTCVTIRDIKNGEL